jgi:hypothetical protein
MSLALTWDDLLIQNITSDKAGLWLGHWKGWLNGPVSPICMSKFGDWFLRRMDGSTLELSVIEGTVQTIATTPDEFAILVNTPDWQEKHLLPFLIKQLYERGIAPQAGQCYGFAPHPRFTGKISIDQIMIMEIGIWQSICADTFSKQP